MRIGVIDIGTNTVLLLICDIDASGMRRVLHDEQRFARVGQQVDALRLISTDAFDRCAVILADYVAMARAAGVARLVATGTSAIRDAVNRDSFLAAMSARCEVDIEVLSGDDEAILTFRGAVSGFPSDPTARYAVLDIGGGSTELAIGSEHHLDAHLSMDIGCVRMTEQFLHHAPPLPEEHAALRDALRHTVRGFPDFEAATTTLVAVAGTATSLAAIDLGVERIDDPAVAGHTLARTRVHELVALLRPLTNDALISRYHVDPGRADILLAGLMILQSIMDARAVDHVHISGRGLRYGVALREASHGS